MNKIPWWIKEIGLFSICISLYFFLLAAECLQLNKAEILFSHPHLTSCNFVKFFWGRWANKRQKQILKMSEAAHMNHCELPDQNDMLSG